MRISSRRGHHASVHACNISHMHRFYSSSCVSSCMPSSVMYSGMYYCTCLTSPGTDYWNFDYKKMYKTGTIFERHLLAAMDRCIAVLHATLAHFQGMIPASGISPLDSWRQVLHSHRIQFLEHFPFLVFGCFQHFSQPGQLFSVPIPTSMS